MIPDVQRETLAALAEVWALSPDVRLGQLLAHLGFLGKAHLGRGLGYLEDDELMAILYRHRAKLEARFHCTSDPAPHRALASTSVSGSPTLVEAAPTTEASRSGEELAL
jgi:hypothetical protein